ncbi:hypothetical protein QQ045_024107 [Rhodiola kirilowii]
MELLVKGNAMKQSKNMSRNMNLFIIEVVGCFIILMLLSSLPSPVVNMAEMSMSLRELISVFRFSTHSVFIIGNLIIILVVKLSGDTTPSHKLEFVRDQYVTESRRRVFQVKKLDEEPRETRTDQLCPAPFPEPIENVVPAAAAEVVVQELNSQVYRRTLSASYERGGGGGVVRAKKRPELRRSKTVKGDGDVRTTTFDELNHDEFRRKIETFIAKQRRLIREEM